MGLIRVIGTIFKGEKMAISSLWRGRSQPLDRGFLYDILELALYAFECQ